MRTALSAFGLALAALATPAAAQDERPRVSLDIGFGAAVTPDYPGSSDQSIGPTGSFALRELVLPGGFGFGSASARPVEPGFGLRGGFRYIGARKASDNPELAGLENVDAAFEIGLGVTQVSQFWRVFAEARYGVIGHKGWAGDLGADVIWRVSENTTLLAGPRARFGDRRFVQTYFGVTEAEAAASSFAAYNPSGGLVATGVEFGLQHRFTDAWGLQGRINYDRLQDDAGRSPIVAQGSRDQWSARLIFTYSFGLGR
jgi:outer membrane scaffolding protein for murein synthesis (MipA/OmpV family)